MRIAFMGFRHGHINGLYAAARKDKTLAIAGACEEHAPTREATTAAGRIRITHEDYAAMLDAVECDVVAVGDYYARRGAIIIEALKRGKHVIADKPICTRLDELDEIERLAAANGLCVGCMLDLRSNGRFLRIRELVRRGAVGEVHAVNFGGQHPLMPTERAAWYFEPGKHGGTINDIGVHGIDLLTWITGLDVAEVVAARTWNAFVPEHPHFHDGAQFMLRMSNGAGVQGDVSYFMPDSLGYTLRQYWRTTIYGRDGIVEAAPGDHGVFLAQNGAKEARTLVPCEDVEHGYLQAFRRERAGASVEGDLTTTDVLRASRTVLRVQAAADSGATHVELSA